MGAYLEIHQYGIERAWCFSVYSCAFFAVSGEADSVSRLFESFAHDRAVYWIVFCDEDVECIRSVGLLRLSHVVLFPCFIPLAGAGLWTGILRLCLWSISRCEGWYSDVPRLTRL